MTPKSPAYDSKESFKRALQKSHSKEPFKRALQKSFSKKPFKRALHMTQNSPGQLCLR